MKKLVTKNKGQLIWRHRIALLTFHCKIDSTKEMIKSVMSEKLQFQTFIRKRFHSFFINRPDFSALMARL